MKVYIVGYTCFEELNHNKGFTNKKEAKSFQKKCDENNSITTLHKTDFKISKQGILRAIEW